MDEIAERSLAADEFSKESKTLEALSAAYTKYPEFEEYDDQFYENDGATEVTFQLIFQILSA